MATSVDWAIFVVVAVLLGFVGYHFGVRTVRWFTAIVAFGLALAITAYGLALSGPASPNLENSFARGADAVGDAFFHPLGLGNPVSGPGRAGWVVIILLLVLGYRELEAWALHWQAPQLDTSKLGEGQPSIKPDGPAGTSADGLTDGQRHELLAAEVGFRLAAMEVRAPAILPGGSRSGGLATIAETSGFSGGGLAGAIIRFFGLLWPNPRQVQVRVWMESASNGAGPATATRADLARVTVELSDPRNGATLSTKTLAAGTVDECATRVAGYVARQIFSMDPATPGWCFGAPDGGDLAALLLSRQLRVRVETPADVVRSRYEQIALLKNQALGRRCAGVVRYELAQLYSIQGEPPEEHLAALRLHAVNREQYPRFYRGRYRLGMSLEMIADPGFRFSDYATAHDDLEEILAILHRCRLTHVQLGAADEIRPVADGGSWELTPAVRFELLKAAQQELRGVRRQLTIGRVLLAAFLHRPERGIWRTYYPGARARQSFHDGVCVAELLVAARLRATEQRLAAEPGSGPQPAQPAQSAAGQRRLRPLTARHLRLAIRVASAIAGPDPLIKAIPDRQRRQNAHDPWPPAPAPDRPAHRDPRDGLRWWPWSRRTISWQAAYNTACLYAALAAQRLATTESLPAAERRAWDERVVTSLGRVVNNQYAEMERPYDTFSQDPDFSALRSAPGQFPAFRKFLDDQRRVDYPEADVAQARLGLADLPHRDGCPIVSVVAPTGYGKTTVLAQWAQRNSEAFAWVSVDDADNDPKVLLTYVAKALDAAEPVGERDRGVAGLYLAALYLKEGGSLASVDSFAGDDRLVSEYLERMCGPLCDAVLDMSGSTAALGDLEQSNLLLVPLDRRGDWYRYHHLFREMLLAELHRQDSGLMPILQRRTAQWYERNREPEGALEYWTKAGDVDSAARLVGALAFLAYQRGKVATVERWLAWLEDRAAMESYPAICLEWSAARALAAGATDDEIADALLAIAPVTGLGRVVCAAPDVATALGYDVGAALEEPDDP